MQAYPLESREMVFDVREKAFAFFGGRASGASATTCGRRSTRSGRVCREGRPERIRRGPGAVSPEHGFDGDPPAAVHQAQCEVLKSSNRLPAKGNSRFCAVKLNLWGQYCSVLN